MEISGHFRSKGAFPSAKEGKVAVYNSGGGGGMCVCVSGGVSRTTGKESRSSKQLSTFFSPPAEM